MNRTAITTAKFHAINCSKQRVNCMYRSLLKQKNCILLCTVLVYDTTCSLQLPFPNQMVLIQGDSVGHVSDSIGHCEILKTFICLITNVYRERAVGIYKYKSTLNLLKTKSNLLYIRNQLVPRSKHFLPQL